MVKEVKWSSFSVKLLKVPIYKCVGDKRCCGGAARNSEHVTRLLRLSSLTF